MVCENLLSGSVRFFLHPLNIYATSSLAKVLKLSLAKQILTLEDFLKTDHEVLQQMKASYDQDVLALYNNYMKM